jgi:dipeptidyl aminopeptidase/acylaminoacyl peptidase
LQLVPSEDLFWHREQANALFRLVVGIDDRYFDELVEPTSPSQGEFAAWQNYGRATAGHVVLQGDYNSTLVFPQHPCPLRAGPGKADRLDVGVQPVFTAAQDKNPVTDTRSPSAAADGSSIECPAEVLPMKNRGARFLLALVLIVGTFASAQVVPNKEVIRPGDNLIVEGIPSIPLAIAEQANRYTEVRSAILYDWHPVRREMLISTRFAETNQVHAVRTPGGARIQLTFFQDRISGASYEATAGNYFVFRKDVGGGEWFQYYRYDLPSGNVTLLTDGKSRNLNARFSPKGDRMVYTSTRRNERDTDVWMINPADPKSDRMLLQLQGGGWIPGDWSPDDSRFLLREELSVNESYLWLADATTGEKKLITPRGRPEKTAYGPARFSKNGKGIYLTTDEGSEFMRLAYLDLTSGEYTFLSSEILWDVEELDLSEDGRTLAFVTNDNGRSVLYVMDTATRTKEPVPNLPVGIIDSLRWHRNSRDLGFSLSSARATSDTYSLDTRTGELTRWTYSETGGLNAENFSVPALITWRSFDGRDISGWLYQPPAKFSGKRPVIVNIHGGPESQSRPRFIGNNNYFINELGVAMMFPNVRGSTGYGKTFVRLDNGMLRENTYKDIGALLDWIKQQPQLDGSKIMITGGSYGGHMTYAAAAHYNDQLCCSLPIVGITNLVTLLEHTESYRRDLRRAEYGDERDPQMREYLTRIAPMTHADQIRKPVFAVVGKNDPRVPYSESVQILDRIRQNGAPVWFLIASDEGHGYVKKKNRDFQFYATIMFVRQFLLNQPVD